MLKSDFILRRSPLRRLGVLMPLTAVLTTTLALPYPVQTWLSGNDGLLLLLVTCLLLVILIPDVAFQFFKNHPLSSSYTPVDKISLCVSEKRNRTFSQDLRIEFDGRRWCEHLSDGVERKQLDRTRSRLFPFALFLAFTDSQGRRSHRWIMSNECDALYYRRLARAIKS